MAKAVCSVPTVSAPKDFGAQPGSARNYLARIGAIELGLAGPRVSPDDNRIHSIPLKSPLPLPELLYRLHGEPPPDRGKTLEWPHPDWQRENEENS